MTEKERIQFARLVCELGRKIESNELGTELVLLQLEDMTRVSRDAPPTDAGARAENRRRWFELWYSTLGFSVTVPAPSVTDEEFVRRARKRQVLFYRPPTELVSYQAFIQAVGFNDKLTPDIATEVGWEETEEGYWFWAEIMMHCPRRNVSWQNLMFAHRLVSLEEYVIMRWAHWSDTQSVIDNNTTCWLRTRAGSRVLSVNHGGVNFSTPDMLLKPIYNMGGRIMERIT